LRVQNHTECMCVRKNSQNVVQPKNVKISHVLPKSTTKRPQIRCKCPSHFDVEIVEGGSCSCVCRHEKFECQKRFDGREGFNLSDQRYLKILLMHFMTFDFIFFSSYFQMYHAEGLHSTALSSWHVLNDQRTMSRPERENSKGISKTQMKNLILNNLEKVDSANH
jgi:hypothetical protein